MLWIFRMIVRGLLLLIAAAVVRGCDQPTYSVAAADDGKAIVCAKGAA